MKFQVAFVGNFGAPFSTENDLAWTFEQLAWRVIRLQENSASTDDILAAALESDFLLWVHTHGWKSQGRVSMGDVLAVCKERFVPSVGVHLDRYFGIAAREDMVRNHPFFRCAELWTADGGNQNKFSALGIRHHWMPPAICYRHCKSGDRKPEYECDVAWVGSGRDYHQEYPFRRQLIDWLDQPRLNFTVKRWGGDRPGARAELNDIFASCKVVVGDSMFAGAPRYWSDRIPEVRGRGGFLLHPASEGMSFTGLGNYRAQDLEDLESCIGYYLANDEKREEMRTLGYEQTKRHDTYTHRMLAILNHLGMN